jgi:hypothetical protein
MNGEHRTYHDGYSICYWRDGTACGYGDEWKEARFETPGMSRAYVTVETHTDRDDLMRLLEKVFESGRWAKTKELQNLLGIRA